MINQCNVGHHAIIVDLKIIWINSVQNWHCHMTEPRSTFTLWRRRMAVHRDPGPFRSIIRCMFSKTDNPTFSEFIYMCAIVLIFLTTPTIPLDSFHLRYHKLSFVIVLGIHPAWQLHFKVLYSSIFGNLNILCVHHYYSVTYYKGKWIPTNVTIFSW